MEKVALTAVALLASGMDAGDVVARGPHPRVDDPLRVEERP